jgi:preprotein translocase subunit YajC
MATFEPGQRVTTASGNLVGTVIEVLDGSDYVLLEWDDEAGPQEDEVEVSVLHRVTA